jgi:hypothetical protein
MQPIIAPKQHTSILARGKSYAGCNSCATPSGSALTMKGTGSRCHVPDPELQR